jgi:replicative DNA helicase
MNHPDDDEKVLVGLMANYPNVACEAGHRISSLQISNDFYRRIFVAAREAAKDRILCFEEVKRRFKPENQDELMLFAEVYDVRCVELSGRYYIERVIEAAALRKFRNSYHALADSVEHLTVDDALLASEEMSSSIRVPNLWHDWKQYGDDYENDIQTRVENAGKSAPVRLGIAPIDNWLQFQPGHLTVICARPKTGKSFLVAKLINESTVKHDIPGLYCSIEMSAAETYDRILAMQSQVSTKRIQSGNVAPADLSRLGALLLKLKQKPLSFSREEREPRIMSAISEAIQKHRIRYVVIDYLQRIKREGTAYRKKFEEVDQVTENLKAFAEKNEVSIILLSQVNGSGAMAFSASSEAHADEKLIMTAVRDCMPRRVRITIEFQRHGPSGMSCETEFDGDTRFFVPVEPLPTKSKKSRNPYADSEDAVDKLC